MHAIDGMTLDLNQLRVLAVLLQERSVTRAARRLSLTQSTVSHALGKLRERFGDPLLVRSGREMLLTPRAAAMEPGLRRSLGDLVRVVSEDTRFDPASSGRVFSLLCPDLLGALLPGLLGRLQAEAPGVGLKVRSPGGVDPAAELLSGASDAALGPAREVGPGLVRRVLGRVSWCVLARPGHPGVHRGRLRQRDWLAFPHVVVTGDGGPGLVGRALEAARIERRIGFTAPGFLVALMAVAQTEMFFAAPRELVAPLLPTFGLQMLEPPATLPPVPVALTWHERFQAEPGHRWLRELLVRAGQEILGPPGKVAPKG